MFRAHRIKIPVISRLTLAWATLACCVIASGLFAVYGGDARPAQVALAVKGLERFAPPVSPPERLPAKPATVVAKAPALAAEEPFFVDGEDALGDAFAAPLEVLEQPAADDIVITIDGELALDGDVLLAEARGKPAPVRRAGKPVAIAALDASLIRKTAYGSAPKIGPGGKRAARVYARPFRSEGGPAVAIIVGGLGLNPALTERAIDELPAEVTLAFAPYARDLAYWAERARASGHEIMIELPMEHRGGEPSALGPAALLTSQSPEENLQRLDWLLSRAEGYVGVTNYLGSKFVADDAAMQPVLARIAESGLAYFDDTGAVRIGAKDAGDVAIVNRMIASGYDGDAGSVKRDLFALAATAKRDGDALGKTYVSATALDELLAWTDEIRKANIALAPASGVLALRGGAL